LFSTLNLADAAESLEIGLEKKNSHQMASHRRGDLNFAAIMLNNFAELLLNSWNLVVRFLCDWLLSAIR
jgi:hypothetical protein